MGSIVLALDPRYRTAVLLAGGLSPGAAAPEVDPLNFAPHVFLPVSLARYRSPVRESRLDDR
jgi:hypothetical protein